MTTRGPLNMQIFVDADACPRAIKEILFRSSLRTSVPLTLVANQAMQVPRSTLIRMLVVAPGFDVADHKIVELSGPGDLVITADIPLAAAVLARGALALNPRGLLYTDENIGERLSVRNLYDELRGGGIEVGGGPAALSRKDLQAFANQLDRILAQRK